MTDYPAWPSYALPAPPLNDDFIITLPDNLLRTPMEQGLARQRNTFRSGATSYAVTWPMTPKQFALFLGIKRNLLADGNGWFRLPVFDGGDYTERVVRFVAGPIKPSRSGGEFMTSAVIETIEEVAMSDQDTQVALITYGADTDLDTLVNRLHNIVHVQYPAATL